jgi:hypothetical protein
MRHQDLDRVSLEVARRVAARLECHPELIEAARANLRRWIDRNASAPRLVQGYQEWLTILDLSIPQVQATLTAETDEGQRLRQNSPFVGVLSQEEIKAIRAAVRDDQRAA